LARRLPGLSQPLPLAVLAPTLTWWITGRQSAVAFAEANIRMMVADA